MPDSKFSADLYLSFLLTELRDVYGTSLSHFSPLRVLGSTVGYDYGVYADYWKLRVGNRELDSHILRGLVPAQRRGVLPNRYLSLFIRPETPFHVSTARGKDPEVFEDYKQEGQRGYYRIETSQEYLPAFADFSKGLGALGVALVAAPCFSESAELETRVAAGAVWQCSHWLRPEAISGEYRSYFSPEFPARLHPDGSEVRSQAMPGLLALEREGLDPEPLGYYLNKLWSAARLTIGAGDTEGIGADYARAKEALGPVHASLPLDPLGVLDGLMFEDVPGSGVDLAALGTVIFALQRWLRERTGASWIMLYA